jgi:hypothetical protein
MMRRRLLRADYSIDAENNSFTEMTVHGPQPSTTRFAQLPYSCQVLKSLANESRLSNLTGNAEAKHQQINNFNAALLRSAGLGQTFSAWAAELLSFSPGPLIHSSCNISAHSWNEYFLKTLLFVSIMDIAHPTVFHGGISVLDTFLF